jgi:hypothetical protein
LFQFLILEERMMDMRSEVEKLEEEIWVGEMSDDLFYVSGRGRMLRQKLKCAKARSLS